MRVATQFSIGGRPLSARVCASLREAASQPHFYEALLTFAQQPIPYGDGYDKWRREKAEDMEEGGRVFSAMDPGETPGTRASVDMCEIAIEVELP